MSDWPIHVRIKRLADQPMMLIPYSDESRKNFQADPDQNSGLPDKIHKNNTLVIDSCRLYFTIIFVYVLSMYVWMSVCACGCLNLSLILAPSECEYFSVYSSSFWPEQYLKETIWHP